MPQINFYPALKVWYIEAGSSIERSSKHEVNGIASQLDEMDEVMAQHEEIGHEVIEVRYLRSPVDSGDVLYHNPRF